MPNLQIHNPHFITYAHTNQNRTEYIYDTVMWRLTEQSLYDANDQMIKSEGFDYNSVGNIVNQVNYYNFGGNIHKFMQEYQYDKDNRLTSAYEAMGNSTTLSYDVRFRYSPAGRIIDKALKLTAVKNHRTMQTSYINLYSYENRSNPYAADAIGNEALCWDKAGNLSTVVSNNKPKELMGWTVDSRMDRYFNMEEGTAAVYRYDAAGKRDMKLTGKIANVYNMGKLVRHIVFYDATLYMGNLMTIDRTGYKKHYFIEGERFMTSIGGDGRGIADRFQNVGKPVQFYDWLEKTLAKDDFGECSKEKYVFEPRVIDFPYFYRNFFASMPVTDDLLYYHHSDRLGSGSVITSHRSGKPVHILAYIPYGETLLDLSDNSGYQMPYQFAGYEKDQESGLSYATARYYSARRSIFTSTDPMWAKYPYQSGYVYCGNNPVNIIDPDGRDEWEINKQGKITKHIKTTEHDAFFMVDKDGNRIADKELILKYGTIESQRTTALNSTDSYDTYKVRGDANGTQMFEFMSQNTAVEWSQAKTGIAGDKGLNFLTTSHDIDTERGMLNLYVGRLQYKYTIRELNHNHPSNIAYPSGSFVDPITGKGVGKWGDVGFARKVVDNRRINKLNVPAFNIFLPATKSYISYGVNSIISDYGR